MPNTTPNKRTGSRRPENLNDGPVRHQLWRLSAPMSVGLLSVLAVGLADAFFLARAGDAELAAIGFVYPVIVTISSFSVGLAAGTNTVLSQSHGASVGSDRVAHLAFHASVLGLAAGLTIALAFRALSGPLFTALGAEGEVRDLALAYAAWWTASFPVLVLTMVINSAFRAAGDTFTAAAIMVLTAVLNIGLTPVLIFGTWMAPELGMAGAGLATFLARAVALAVVLALALRRGMIRPDARPFDGLLKSARGIVGVALPAGGSRAINPAGMAAVTAAVATLGDTAVAGFGAASRVQAVTLVPFFALAAGLGPVVGQAWGAGNADRARAALRIGMIACLAYGAGLAVILVLFANQLAAFMTADGAAAAFAADYLRFVGWTLGGYGLVVAANGAMTARSRAGWAMGLSLARIGLVYLPLAWVGVLVAGYPGVLAAAALANLVAGWGALVAARATGIGPVHAAVVSAPAQWLAQLLGAEPRTRAVR